MSQSHPAVDERNSEEPGLRFEESIGFQIRQAHRLLQRYLQMQIEPYGITLGMWYFLRVLWDEDGLTQRELSQKVGTMEPTTLVAIKSMLASGLVERRRNSRDGRKLNIFLTRKGKALKDECAPKAMQVNAIAAKGISKQDQRALLGLLMKIQDNISHQMEQE